MIVGNCGHETAKQEICIMGGKDLAKAIRRINKGSKANEPVFDPTLLPAGSIIAVDLSTLLVPYIKSSEGAAQMSAVPVQSCTCIQDKLESMYLNLNGE